MALDELRKWAIDVKESAIEGRDSARSIDDPAAGFNRGDFNRGRLGVAEDLIEKIKSMESWT